MKRLSSLLIAFLILVGMSFSLSSCGECVHSYSFTFVTEKQPTCTTPGLAVEYSYCDKCGERDYSYQGSTNEIPPDPNWHRWGNADYVQYEDSPGLRILAIRCLDCNEIDSYIGDPEHDPNFTCPPHNSYDGDDYCDFCYENINQINCTAHTDSNGDDYCDTCSTYIPPKTSATSITLNSSSCRVDIGETYTFTYSYYPSDAEDVEVVWSTTTPDIISIDQNGVVTAISNGVGEIVVSLADNSDVSDTASVYSGEFPVAFSYSETSAYDMYQGYRIVGINSEYLPETLVIPAEYNGVAVVEISNQAFRELVGVKKIVVPEGVKVIEDCAIGYCEDLETIELPNSLEYCTSESVYECPMLSYTTDATGKYLGNTNNPYLVLIKGAEGITSFTANAGTRVICAGAFKNFTSLISVDLGSVVRIGWEAFYNTGITEIVIPDTVKVIDDSAFRDCAALTSITIGKNVQNIYSYAFIECPLVDYIYFNAANMGDVLGGNAVFNFRDDSVSDVEKTAVIVIGADVVRLPNLIFERVFNYAELTVDMSGATSLVEIGKSAFANVSYKLYEVEIPAGVTKIGDKAFASNQCLNKVYFKSGLTSVGEDAYLDCYSIETIFFDNANLDAAAIKAALPKSWGQNTVTIIIGDSITKIPDKFVKGVFTSSNTNADFTLKVDLSTDVDYSIGNSAFSGAPIKAFDLSSVVSLGTSVFEDCKLLSSVDMSECEITEISAGTFAGCIALEEITLPAGITAIRNRAFAGSSITSLAIPSTVTQFGSYIFDGCASLSSVNLPSNMTEIPANFFSGCVGYNDTSILENVTKIGEYAFWGTGIVELTIPANITDIGAYAFGNCKKLETINHNGKNLQAQLDANIFDGAGSDSDGITVNIGKDVTRISKNLFKTSNGVNITEIIFADSGSLTMINDYAFSGLTGVTDLSIPETVTFIGTYAFSDMKNLTKLNIHIVSDLSVSSSSFKNVGSLTDGIELTYGSKTAKLLPTLFELAKVSSIVFEDGMTLKEISSNAFWYIGKTLKSITLHEGLESLDMAAFFGCEHITEIDIPSTVTEIKGLRNNHPGTDYCDPKVTVINVHQDNDSFVFTDGVLYSKDGTMLVWYPCARSGDKFVIPSNVTAIADGAFAFARELQEVVIPENVTVIPDYAFFACNNLQTVNIEHLTKIGEFAFGYTNITEFTAPDGVTEIANRAFYKSALTKITLGSQVKSIGAEAFFGSGFIELNLSEGLETIGYKAFYNVYEITTSSGDAFVIPSTVTSIGELAFGFNPSDYNNFGGNTVPTLYIGVTKNYGTAWYDSHCNVSTVAEN